MSKKILTFIFYRVHTQNLDRMHKSFIAYQGNERSKQCIICANINVKREKYYMKYIHTLASIHHIYPLEKTCRSSVSAKSLEITTHAQSIRELAINNNALERTLRERKDPRIRFFCFVLKFTRWYDFWFEKLFKHTLSKNSYPWSPCTFECIAFYL